MNLMLLSAAAVVLICVLVGLRRGLIKSAVSAVGIVGAIMLANICNPYVDDFLCKHTEIRNVVHNKIENNLGFEDVRDKLSVYEQEDYIEKINLPEIVKDYIRSGDKKNPVKNNNTEKYLDYVTDYLTDMVMSGIAYILTVVIVGIVLLIALGISNILSGVPVIGGIDRVGGALFGFVQGMLIVWLMMLVITFQSAFSWGNEMMSMIDGNDVLSYVYKKNIFLKIVVDILGDI